MNPRPCGRARAARVSRFALVAVAAALGCQHDLAMPDVNCALVLNAGPTEDRDAVLPMVGTTTGRVLSFDDLSGSSCPSACAHARGPA